MAIFVRLRSEAVAPAPQRSSQRFVRVRLGAGPCGWALGRPPVPPAFQASLRPQGPTPGSGPRPPACFGGYHRPWSRVAGSGRATAGHLASTVLRTACWAKVENVALRLRLIQWAAPDLRLRLGRL